MGQSQRGRVGTGVESYVHSLHDAVYGRSGRQKYGVSAQQCPERPAGRSHEPSRLFLDNDLTRKVVLEAQLAEKVKRQLTRDSLFLESQGLMDYSLLLGVHSRRCLITHDSLVMGSRSLNRSPASVNDASASTDQGAFSNLKRIHSSTSATSSPSTKTADSSEEISSIATPLLTSALHKHASRQSRFCRFGNQMLKAAWIAGPSLYWVSIIDYLQSWTLKKKLERGAKMIIRCKGSDGFCAVPPGAYGRRFRERIVEGAIEAAPEVMYRDVGATLLHDLGGDEMSSPSLSPKMHPSSPRTPPRLTKPQGSARESRVM